MAKQKIIKLSQGLILNKYLLSLFGVTDFEGIAQYTRESNLEGYDENNVSKYYSNLLLRLSDPCVLTKDQLLRYDQNIYRYTEEISRLRSNPIKWRYFQYFTLLFVEIYLDKYFSNREGLLNELNEFVAKFNDPFNDKVENEYGFVAPEFEEGDLNKLAIWSATGSGKTLLLHINIKQFNHYASKENYNRILLITPNEGLSAQHLVEFRESNIDASIFSNKSSIGFFSGKSVEIIEISKLKEESGEKTVAVDSFETNNLVLVDEGHRGTGGDEWKARRDLLSEKGFAFEYSATFGQAISAANKNKREPLLQEYSKAIIFDYSYKYFYKDGYGKDYRILNIEDNSNEDYLRRYMTACLMVFYQKLLVFSENKEALKTFKIEKPLWVFVGGSVTKSMNKAEASDVITIIKFIADFVKDSRVSKAHINQILTNQSGLNDSSGNSIFYNTFTYLKNKDFDSESIYNDILLKVFNSSLSGANLHVDNLKGATGELGLRIGEAQDYFGVINVGDDSKLYKLCIDNGVLGSEKDFSSSLFHDINKENSAVNLLIGSRKFTEGWSSWRVSTMGLMKIGRGEGSQIIQLFGRGVRLKGYQTSLKRSSALDQYQRPTTDIPDYLKILETLSIFGIKADYMQQFKAYLEEEGLKTDNKVFVKVNIPTKKRYKKERDQLRLIKPKGEVVKTFKKKQIIELEIRDFAGHFNITLDWYPKIQSLQSTKGASIQIESRGDGQQLSDVNLAFIDWDKVFFELQRYKNERSWYNLSIQKEQLQKIMNDKSWYEIKISPEDLKPTSFEKVFWWQEIVISLLKKYTEKFYLSQKSKYLSRHIEVSILEDSSSMFESEYEVEIDENHEEIISEVKRFKEKVEDRSEFESMVPIFNRNFSGLDVKNHGFFPLIYVDDSTLKDVVKVSPVPLNEGERDFVNDLKLFLDQNPDYTEDKKLYLLRNPSRKGVGFFGETNNFYPDFILWQVIGEKQYLSFIDPKGLRNMDGIWKHPKVDLHKTIKSEFQARLEDKNTFLNSFIVSNTSFRTLQYRFSDDGDITRYHNHNIYFQEEDKNNYIKEILNKGLIE